MTGASILHYLRTCPGPHFRELVRELSLPVGTAQYWVTKLLQTREIYVVDLAQRPRYFPSGLDEVTAAAIYVVREARLRPSVVRQLATYVSREALRRAVAYPCVQRDLVDVFMELFWQL
ncbi:hypothetical protein [Pyrobaculum ferrireducens]|uniref:HVO-0163 N-terminal HTH domain-containing protein n=1 Tax=Pyrobaculum ferrireducens TaxID=1104324 RepID=G7VAH7_9CREN|nr:hypothetical protein [Pyrobaculum ferrireducens]AET32216.1 hypothetical protein P186_0770 [Pyrobaculum ferrireducens]